MEKCITFSGEKERSVKNTWMKRGGDITEIIDGFYLISVTHSTVVITPGTFPVQIFKIISLMKIIPAEKSYRVI